MEIFGVKVKGPGVLLFGGVAHIARDVRVRQSFLEGAWAASARADSAPG